MTILRCCSGAGTGLNLLIVEQEVRDLLPIFDRVYSVKLGRVAFEGKPDGLLDDVEPLKALSLLPFAAN